METWVLPAFLGLGLAASAGLKAFAPLLVIAIAARLHLFGFELGGAFAWLESTAALVALSVAAAIELAADKIPLVDHALSAVGVVARPAAGVLATAAAFSHHDPAAAALAGLIVGAPAALAAHSAQTATRIAATATTAGLANPVVSLIEDLAAYGGSFLALAVPVLVPVVLLIVVLLWRRAAAAGRRRRE